jgi:hypothetical protein
MYCEKIEITFPFSREVRSSIGVMVKEKKVVLLPGQDVIYEG